MTDKTNKNLIFKDQDELLDFLKRQNPTFLKFYKEQYEAENVGWIISGMGSRIEIKKGNNDNI